jgi:hypothetical protein
MDRVNYWVRKARSMNWLCIWPRTANSLVGARKRRDLYMKAARTAKANL